MSTAPDTFFTDEGLAGRLVPQALRDAGEQVLRHADAYPAGTPDTVWLAQEAAKGHLILTKDVAIGRNPLEKAMVRMTGAKVFALSSASMTGPDMAEAFVKARHRMKQFARKYKGPFIAKVDRDGKVRAWKGPTDL